MQIADFRQRLDLSLVVAEIARDRLNLAPQTDTDRRRLRHMPKARKKSYLRRIGREVQKKLD